MLAISVPLVATVTTDEPEDAFEENREPAPLPAWPHDRESLAAWPDAFTKYFADHFAFRSQLVRWQSRFRVQVLRSSTTPDVILGRDGWLFYGTDGAAEDYSGSRPFTEIELEAWRDTLQHTQDWLQQQGIDYVFAVAPDKHVIYPEFMPAGVNQGLSHSRAEQLLDHLRAHSTVHVADLRPPVLSARNAGRLFHVTDTHWNDLGAFVAYRQVIEQLGNPGGPPATFDDFERQQVMRPGLDLASMLGLKGVLEEEDLRLEPRTPRRARVIEPVRASRALMDARVVTEQPGTRPARGDLPRLVRLGDDSVPLRALQPRRLRLAERVRPGAGARRTAAGRDPGMGRTPPARDRAVRRRRALAQPELSAVAQRSVQQHAAPPQLVAALANISHGERRATDRRRA